MHGCVDEEDCKQKCVVVLAQFTAKRLQGILRNIHECIYASVIQLPLVLP